MKPLIIPKSYNYIAVFLSLSCNLKCSYCINHYGESNLPKGHLSGRDWVRGLNRIESRDDLPITLQGGEPSLHKDFIYILNNIERSLNIDVLTNLQFDENRFMRDIHPDRIKRNAPYASIRVSYHPEVMDLDPLLEKTLELLRNGYSVGIWGLAHPNNEKLNEEAKRKCSELGIDFRLKEFLGKFNDRLYGTYFYKGSVENTLRQNVLCKTTELIIGPNGMIYRCHGDLYEDRESVGNILDPEFEIKDIYRECNYFGHCNPCDVKLKTNRFQKFGHTSVTIKFNETGDPAKQNKNMKTRNLKTVKTVW